MQLRSLLARLNAERVSWFGAGLSAAALGVVGYQLVLASLLAGQLPGLQLTPSAAGARGPPWPTRTLFPSPTAFPTRTPFPTRSPTPTRAPPPTPTPGPTHTPWPTRTAYPTHTPWPTHTSLPTHTPWPTRTPAPPPGLPGTPRMPGSPALPGSPGGPDALATLVSGDPAGLVASVATLVSTTRDALQTLQLTAEPR